MMKPRLRDLAMLVLSISMVIVGYLGLVGKIQNTPTLLAALLAIMVVFSFSLGRQSTHLPRK